MRVQYFLIDLEVRRLSKVAQEFTRHRIVIRFELHLSNYFLRFERFVNMIINDTNYSMDEGIQKLLTILKLEEK
jgi:hypothetical protein